jgi:hypothetical protein
MDDGVQEQETEISNEDRLKPPAWPDYRYRLSLSLLFMVRANRPILNRGRAAGNAGKGRQKSNSLYIELSWPMRVAVMVYERLPACTGNSWRNQIRQQNIFTSLNCQRHRASAAA